MIVNKAFILKDSTGRGADAAADLAGGTSSSGTLLSVPVLAARWEAAFRPAHVLAGLDEEGVSPVWDPVLRLPEEKVPEEEEGRSGGAAGRGQGLPAVQVRR